MGKSKTGLTMLRPRVATLDQAVPTLSGNAGATRRIRGRALQRIRERILRRANGLCEPCGAKGIFRRAIEVDHRTPLHQGGQETDENRQAICAECHLEKTARDAGHAPRRRIGLDGTPEDGSWK